MWQVRKTSSPGEAFIREGLGSSLVGIMASCHGPVSIQRPSFPGMGIPMLKIRRSRDRLIISIGVLILMRWHLYIKTAPWLALTQCWLIVIWAVGNIFQCNVIKNTTLTNTHQRISIWSHLPNVGHFVPTTIKWLDRDGSDSDFKYFWELL